MSNNLPQSVDSVDLKILGHLQRHGDATTAEVAAAVGLSASPCWRRIQRLEESGILKSRVALLDRKALGFGVLVFAHVKLEAHGGNRIGEFRDAIGRLPEVQECFVLMGQVDFMIRVVTRDIEAYEKLF